MSGSLQAFEVPEDLDGRPKATAIPDAMKDESERVSALPPDISADIPGTDDELDLFLDPEFH